MTPPRAARAALLANQPDVLQLTVHGADATCLVAVACHAQVTIADVRGRLSGNGLHVPACAGKTGEVLWMKEPDGEGLASHADSESCAAVREDGGEAGHHGSPRSCTMYTTWTACGPPTSR